MFLTLHGATGAFVGQFTANPVLAFVFGFLSHFPLDVFPHGDRAFALRAKRSVREAHRFMLLITADLVIGAVVLGAAFLFQRFDQPTAAFWGMIGGLLPDAIVAIPEYAMFVRKSKRVWFRWFYRLHDYNHNRVITSFDCSLRTGMVAQGILLVLLWKLW
ncbi:hypothetical protein HYV74_03840 [Candidatus Uhrbacteria bacterium]|nr:hypothetical protein [Candidatus Uhrbacteria bacterium]